MLTDDKQENLKNDPELLNSSAPAPDALNIMTLTRDYPERKVYMC